MTQFLSQYSYLIVIIAACVLFLGFLQAFWVFFDMLRDWIKKLINKF